MQLSSKTSSKTRQSAPHCISKSKALVRSSPWRLDLFISFVQNLMLADVVVYLSIAQKIWLPFNIRRFVTRRIAFLSVYRILYRQIPSKSFLDPSKCGPYPQAFLTIITHYKIVLLETKQLWDTATITNYALLPHSTIKTYIPRNWPVDADGLNHFQTTRPICRINPFLPNSSVHSQNRFSFESSPRSKQKHQQIRGIWNATVS